MTLYPPGYSQLVYRIKQTLKALARRKQNRELPIRKWKITRGDKVQITSGRGKGGIGIVKRVNRKKNRLTIEGQALVKDTRKATETTKGSFIIRESPVHYSRVQLVDPVSGRATKMRWAFLEDGAKVRIAAKSGAIIPKPTILKVRLTSSHHTPSHHHHTIITPPLTLSLSLSTHQQIMGPKTFNALTDTDPSQALKMYAPHTLCTAV